jgi:hypothetical protein
MAHAAGVHQRLFARPRHGLLAPNRWFMVWERKYTMDIETIRAFFMWCTIINGSLFILAFLITAFAGDWVYRLNSAWYRIPRDTFNMVIYCFIGLFKLFVVTFNVVPFLALLIIG